MQVNGKVRLPEGKKISVNIGVDFDAHSVWMGAFKLTTPAYMNRGEFGAEVGAPRLLKLFEKYNIKTTWCIPGHTVDTFTERCKEVVSKGHEVAHHGYAHENVSELSLEEEEKVMKLGLEALERIGVKPRGYRSPAWDYSPNTLSLIEKYGFDYDSSLMANDLHPYRPCAIEVNQKKANEYSEPSKVTEFPVSWYLDDFPTQELVLGSGGGLTSADVFFDRCKATFDYAIENEEEPSFILTVHPQTIGRAHMIPKLEELIQYMEERGAWFASLSEMYDAYYEQ
ncbi:polysaccharide deacetylase family protein [Halobacillus litoralis]|uniref:polysaccharide deacetylase family protein n=1 Tax=Halobacillus litoralis TaxID=45668 RepID=UPI002493C181|nr:polysaccharide deacetylase [Halobacillus litoralis]